MENPRPSSSIVRNIYFLIGIIATLAYRVIVVIPDRSTVQALWYVGTIGFIIYFLHRYQVSQKRAHIIAERSLAAKISGISELDEEDKQAMAYIFSTLKSTKEKWNSVVIFISSLLALLVGVYVDFLSRL